jgi:hypothetical protein
MQSSIGGRAGVKVRKPMIATKSDDVEASAPLKADQTARHA